MNIGGGAVVFVLVAMISSLAGLALLVEAASDSPPAESMVKPGCTNFSCGNLNIIPYPFGIGEGCYSTSWFSIHCNRSFDPPKPFLNHPRLSSSNLEVLSISLEDQTVTLNSPVSSLCVTNSSSSSSSSSNINGTTSRKMSKTKASMDMSGSPFYFSTAFNIFMVLGCGTGRLLLSRSDKYDMAGCGSICRTGGWVQDTTKGECFGVNCCQTAFASVYYFQGYVVKLTTEGEGDETAGCLLHAFLAGSDWFSKSFSGRGVVETGYAPLVMYWDVEDDDLYSNGGCKTQSPRTYCRCTWGKEGNPHLKNGCRDVKGCANCAGRCESAFDPVSKSMYFFCNTKKRVKALIIGFSVGGGSLLLLLGSFGLYKVVKKKREIICRRQFFKRNGGLLLEQQISSDKVAVERTKVFTSSELEKATGDFNLNRILGQGGQGTVYKGMLTDGKIVAVKKSKIADESQVEHFINEIVILSQINHRNVVGLLGCCLETEVPLLVYEFISNGNLFQLIHNPDNDFLLSWKMRLQIATEVAGALAYLHSACSIPIYHRDIKSTNILLDDKYRAKVSDFGISRSIAVEQTHLTTAVQGTFGYLDPEYFRSSQFTEKSDVYSFGVVLAELLTGKKPIFSTSSQEEKGLASYFILSVQESRLFDILDARVVAEGGKEEILALAYLACQCLDMDGKKRPSMKEATLELERIKMSLNPTLKVEQNFEASGCIEDHYEITTPLDGISSFTTSYLNCNKASLLDEEPFLPNTI